MQYRHNPSLAWQYHPAFIARIRRDVIVAGDIFKCDQKLDLPRAFSFDLELEHFLATAYQPAGLRPVIEVNGDDDRPNDDQEYDDLREVEQWS